MPARAGPGVGSTAAPRPFAVRRSVVRAAIPFNARARAVAPPHPVRKVLAPVHIDLQPVREELDRLYDAARSNSVHELMESLKRLVPEFKPSYSFIGEAPLTFQRVRPDLFPHP